MRRSIVWALAAAVVLSIAALWERPAPRLVAAVEARTEDRGAPAAGPPALPPKPARPAGSLPANLLVIDVEAARRDPFAVDVPAGPSAATPAQASHAPMPQAIPPAVPKLPVLNLRFLGRMVTPAGEQLLYLARGDAAVVVGVGDRLDEGYVVESLGAEGVTLVYPELSAKVVVPIPPQRP